MLEDIYFAAGWGWAVMDCIEVAVQLEEVAVVLGLVGGVKIVLAAEVCECSLLPEFYCLALNGDGQGCGGGLFQMDLVVGKFVCAEFTRKNVWGTADVSRRCVEMEMFVGGLSLALVGE